MNIRHIAAASAVALLATVSVASAAEMTGTISAITADSVTLDGGKTFVLSVPEGADSGKPSDLTASFKMGDKVSVVYADLDGKPTATQITAIK